MKIYIFNINDGTFTNDSGEKVDFANAHILDDEHHNGSNRKGKVINKVGITKGLIHQIDAKFLPGYFECELVPAPGGRMRIASAKPLQQ
jgi:hypothetical protein